MRVVGEEKENGGMGKNEELKEEVSEKEEEGEEEEERKGIESEEKVEAYIDPEYKISRRLKDQPYREGRIDEVIARSTGPKRSMRGFRARDQYEERFEPRKPSGASGRRVEPGPRRERWKKRKNQKQRFSAPVDRSTFSPF